MEPYSFWQDFFSTYRGSSDAIKALWVIVPPAFVLGLCWIVLHPLGRLRETRQRGKTD